MDRLFDDFTRGSLFAGTESAFINPAVDVSETEEGIELKIDLPGVDEKDIDVEYSDGVLTIRAERDVEEEVSDEKKRFHLMERSYGTYMRRLRLPFEADPDKISATFDKGVVTIDIPRPAEVKPASKRIAVATQH